MFPLQDFLVPNYRISPPDSEASCALLQGLQAAEALTNNLLQKFSQTAEKISGTEENYKSFQLQSHKETFNTNH